MIRFATEDDTIQDLMRLCRAASVSACRIGTLFRLYGGYDDIARFWVGYDGNEPYCAVSLYGGCMTVQLCGSASDELREFVLFISPQTVFCEKPLFPDIPPGITGQIMRLSDRTQKKPQGKARVVSGYEEIQTGRLYELLQKCRCEDIMVPAYEEFTEGVCRFQRSGAARCSLAEAGDEILSFAMTQFLTDSAAIVGSVCTAPKSRGKGLGSSCVSALCAALGDREIFIIRSPERNESFYRRLGFENSGKIFVYRLS